MFGPDPRYRGSPDIDASESAPTRAPVDPPTTDATASATTTTTATSDAGESTGFSSGEVSTAVERESSETGDATSTSDASSTGGGETQPGDSESTSTSDTEDTGSVELPERCEAGGFADDFASSTSFREWDPFGNPPTIAAGILTIPMGGGVGRALEATPMGSFHLRVRLDERPSPTSRFTVKVVPDPSRGCMISMSIERGVVVAEHEGAPYATLPVDVADPAWIELRVENGIAAWSTSGDGQRWTDFTPDSGCVGDGVSTTPDLELHNTDAGSASNALVRIDLVEACPGQP